MDCKGKLRMRDICNVTVNYQRRLRMREKQTKQSIIKENLECATC